MFRKKSSKIPPDLISANKVGFTDVAQKVTLSWDEVDAVTAYKVDLSSIDCIYVTVTGADRTFAFHEQMPGWRNFVDQLHNAFPSIDQTWETTIAFPPFAENLTVLYSKPPDQGDS